MEHPGVMDKDLLLEANRILEGRKKALKDLALRIHARPELALEETEACRWQVELLRRWKFRVTSPYGGLSTAYRADCGRGKPVLAFMAEYDALPGLGHGCGHNLIAAAGVGAGYLLSRLLESRGVGGTVTVMGTPGEEGASGKVIMIRNGALKGVDAAMMCHPNDRSEPDTGNSAIQRLEVTFRGKAAHAAGSPELGRNALDAVNLLYGGVGAWRQHLPESSRVHGVVTAGGIRPNIVPDLASCRFYLRSPDDRCVKSMVRRFRDIVRGAALMTGTTAEVRPYAVPTKGRKPSPLLGEAWAASARLVGLKVVTPEKPVRGSSDFGNVSHVVPAIHPYFGISSKPIPGHSRLFARAAKSRLGIENTFRMTVALALTGFRFMADEGFRKSVISEFRRRRKTS
jgi:amidohydrolase